MPAQTVSCPSCRAGLKVPENVPAGAVANCPRCGKPVTLSAMPSAGQTRSAVEGDGSRLEPTVAPDAPADESSFLEAPKGKDELGRLGPYRVLRKLGEGGMGMVFEAEDPKLRRHVALKVMLPQYAASAMAKARFLREARAQAAVEHDHVAAIFVVGDDQAVPYIVMPLLKGQTLQAALKTSPTPPAGEILRVGREMAEGLAAAHAVGLIHRDIKPANVWLEGGRRRVKILDFGLARATAGADIDVEDAEDPKTQQGTIVGTPSYMSPEQAQGGAVDDKTDLWSLGIVLYQMATGTVPFRAANAMGTLMAVMAEPLVPPITKNPALPRPLNDLIVKLLAKTPTARPQSATRVAEELARIETLATTVVSGPPAANDPWADIDVSSPLVTEASRGRVSLEPVGTSKPPGADKSGSPKKWLLIGAVVLLLAGLVTGAVVLSGGVPKPVVAETATPADARPPVPRPTPLPAVKENPKAPNDAPVTDENWKPDLYIGPPGLRARPDGLPPRLTAPFTPAEAKEAQEAWAKHLGRKVEETIDLGRGTTLVVVLIPPGTYVMGEGGKDTPRHPVELTRPFYLGKYEATQKQFQHVMGTNPSHFSPPGNGKDNIGVADTSDYPVENATWDEARLFGERAGGLIGWKGRGGLPTEAEWEYAYRAGTMSPYYFGDGEEAIAAFGNMNDAARKRVEPDAKYTAVWDDGYPFTAPVGKFGPNAFGLHDMAGNVREVVQDWYGPYGAMPKVDPVQLSKASDDSLVLRGGSWSNNAFNCRAAYRSRVKMGRRTNDSGFRFAFHIE